MRGKHVAITGPTAGIGRAASIALASKGAQLTLLCRNPDKAQELQQEIVSQGGLPPIIVEMDMASLASVRKAAEAILAQGNPLHVLLNNAGTVNTTRRVTVDGFEETLAVNHFAPFLLTGLLLPTLQAAPGSRIVNVSSDAHAFVRHMGFEDLHAEHSYKTFSVYGRSKLANILFTRSLAHRMQGRELTVNCLHPGAVSTSLGSQNEGLFASILPRLLKPFFLTPEQGARTSIYLCSSAEVAAVSGAYFVKCRELKPKPWALDDEAAAQLWEITEKSVGFSYPGGGIT